MSLSSEIISEFVKVTKDDKKVSEETTVNGTTVSHNGSIYVKLDGSELLTPITTIADVRPDERVTVLIKNHTATITGNRSSPAARTDDVKEVGSKINEFEIIMSYKVKTEDLEAINATIDNLRTKVANIENLDVTNLEAFNAAVDKLEATFADIEYIDAKNIDAIKADIENIQVEFGKFTDISTENFESVNADIQILNGYTADFTYISAEVLDAVRAEIKDADIKYAKVDFANIGEAAIRKLFSDSGLIKDLVINEGHITGELVGVTIIGDTIKGGTVTADKLVIKGTDGLYYKLNFEGGTFSESEVVPTDSLHGSIITAKSVTAEKVSVSDLVAFEATIGGINIDDHAMYSGVKGTVETADAGFYMNDSGEFAVGDGVSFLKFYYDAESDSYKLAISAESISFSTGTTVEEAINFEVQNGVNQSTEISKELVDESLADYVGRTEYDEYKENTNAALEETNDTVASNFNTNKESIDSVHNEIAEEILLRKTHIDFTDGITISGGQSGGIKIKLGDIDIEDETGVVQTVKALGFYKEGEQYPFGYWDGDEFHTGNIFVETSKRARFGNFAFVPRGDGSLSLLKVGE